LAAPTDDQVKKAIAANRKELEAGDDDENSKQFMEQLQAILSSESFHNDEELGKDGWGELVMARIREAVAS